jgi:glycosyltransferase involved in cell wall biosynthesis
MKIGIVTTWFERGAAYVSRQYEQILCDNHEVFINSRGGPICTDNSWNKTNLKKGKHTFIPVTSAIDENDFKKWITNNHLDCVFFNEQQWWPPVVWVKELNIKVGAYVDYYTEETIPLFGIYDFLICNTQRHFEAFNWHKQAIYIPWGTNVNLFKPVQNRTNENNITFFSSSGYNPIRKGTDLVIKAFSEINDNSRLIVHSQVDLKKALPELNEQIDKLLYEGKLQIINKTVSAPGLYYLGDVFVQPSRLEGIGLPAAEALSSGLPFVTVDNAPMNEFHDPKSGKLAKVKRYFSRADGYYWPSCETDIHSLKDCMQYYIDNLKNINVLKKQAREFAEDKLDWFKNSKKVNDAFTLSERLPISNSKELIDRFEQRRRTLLFVIAKFNPFAGRIIRKLYKMLDIPTKK